MKKNFTECLWLASFLVVGFFVCGQAASPNLDTGLKDKSGKAIFLGDVVDNKWAKGLKIIRDAVTGEPRAAIFWPDGNVKADYAIRPDAETVKK